MASSLPSLTGGDADALLAEVAGDGRRESASDRRGDSGCGAGEREARRRCRPRRASRRRWRSIARVSCITSD
jgi:hypothetical protein